ncbi:LysE family transporter [Herbiconiux sp.]|uniref:LysE family translocator n=1 Tax=Herbiconiux sp. TaxID=1871186 RepID=UPI0025C23C51|nr:LysE family transporter [Herbiconiux sp.]
MDVLFALASGLVAGLALAAPLGAIGVMLIQEGVSRGLRRGLPGAAAVATVDILYCTAAVTAGALVGPLVGALTPWPQIVGGAALVVIGVRGIVAGGHRPVREGAPDARRSQTSLGRFALFLGLTAINPATVVYFGAILTGLGQVAESVPTGIAFIAGVGVASFSWQALLVLIGAALRRRTGSSFQRWTALLGNGLVVLLGVLLLARIG